jgi:lipopolysaccharide export system ATP-binding protein
MSTLQVRSLRKQYRKKVAVKNVSLSVNSGEIIGLLGPNGAGKTTTFYMIVGLLKAEDGEILLDDKVITRAPMHQRAQAGIGYLPQEASVFRKLSAADNLLAVLELRADLDKAGQRRELEQLLDEFSLQGVRDNTGERLSGGERRRVEIARALATKPKFMLLDEPFAGVDPISVTDIKREIRDLAGRNLGVLITDHNVRDTLDICDRAYIVSAGEIIAEGEPEQILQNSEVRSVYLGEGFSL